MASAVLASNNNEPYWSKYAFVRSYENENLSNLNPTQNPRQKSSRNDNVGVNQNHSQNSSEISPLQDYVTIDISEYSKAELMELSRRLNVELNVVRQTLENIEKEPELKSKKRNFIGLKENSQEKKKIKVLNSPELDNIKKKTFTKCATMLTRLMKHKHAWVFNKPVDVVGLGLHDYLQIIEKPMDLGTVKGKMSKKVYEMPGDFADDVRLVFKNAMKYNPKGQDVHIMADELRGVFEKMFIPVFEKFEGEKKLLVGTFGMNNRVVDKIDVAKSRLGDNIPKSLPVRARIDLPKSLGKNFPKSSTIPTKTLGNHILKSSTVPSKARGDKFSKPSTVPSKTLGDNIPSSVIVPILDTLPKPKEKIMEKRVWSFKEKEKLGSKLQELPPDGMEKMLAIVKCNQVGEEIELDIDTVDGEILLELERFVNNYKWPAVVEKSPVRDLMLEVSQEVEVMEVMEEDVDIGDDIPINNYPPLEIEKDSGSSSSSRSSSSSNGSGSVTSSGSSDSDQDSVQSPFVGPQ